MPLKSYRDLDVWKLAIEVVDAVYALTASFPETERFGLVSQMQRAAVSVPANIAEGYGRSHRGDYLRFLSFARGSLCELETLLIIAHRRRYFSRDDAVPVWQTCQRVGKMLHRLAKTLRATAPAEAPTETALRRRTKRGQLPG